jgi:hypothetical protein
MWVTIDISLCHNLFQFIEAIINNVPIRFVCSTRINKFPLQSHVHFSQSENSRLQLGTLVRHMNKASDLIAQAYYQVEHDGEHFLSKCSKLCNLAGLMGIKTSPSPFSIHFFCNFLIFLIARNLFVIKCLQLKRVSYLRFNFC